MELYLQYQTHIHHVMLNERENFTVHHNLHFSYHICIFNTWTIFFLILGTDYKKYLQYAQKTHKIVPVTNSNNDEYNKRKLNGGK